MKPTTIIVDHSLLSLGGGPGVGLSVNTPREAAEHMVHHMRWDTLGDCYATEEQMQALAVGLQRMFHAGCCLDIDVLEHIAAGEHSEVQGAYSQYDGFSVVDETLSTIFEQEPPTC